MTDYRPFISPEEADRVRSWHDRAYKAAQAGPQADREYDFLGTTLVIPPDVQRIGEVSDLLGAAVLAEVRPGDHVLDMGTGCGVHAILAAAAAARVLAVDILPQAVRTAAANAARNGVDATVEVRQSDVFSAVDETFDLIIFNPPFRWFSPRDALEVAKTDENYRTLRTFFAEARRHLTPGGRILLLFGTSGDFGFLAYLLDELGYTTEVLARREVVKGDWPVEYVTLRVT